MAELSGPERVELFLGYGHLIGYGWADIVGRQIVHKVDGPGKFTKLDEKYAWLILDGDDSPSQYVLSIFRDLLVDIDLPHHAVEALMAKRQQVMEIQQRALEEAAARRRRFEQEEAERIREERKRQSEEAAARAEFQKLKSAFGAEEFKDESPVSPLFLILKTIQEGERISKEDEEWLEERGLFRPLAYYWERTYHRDKNIGVVALASRFWRRANESQWAIHLSDHVMNSRLWDSCSPREKSPVLTSRGAALCDLRELDNAEECAREAIELTPNSYHPYNLLGRIYYFRELPAEGDKYFAEAAKRGADQKSAEATIRSVLMSSEREAQKRVAAYLLSKEPARYAWAQRYL